MNDREYPQHVEENAAAGAVRTIDQRWPSVKYLSFGLYSAWILVMMGGAGALLAPSGMDVAQAGVFLYLYSGVPLCVVLVFCGVFRARVAALIERGPLVVIMGLFASMGTFVVMGGAGVVGLSVFAVASVATGVGTAFLCLRIGCLFGSLSSERAFFDTFAAAVFGNFVFFMYDAASPMGSLAIASFLPVLAAVLASMTSGASSKDDADVVPVELLPRGFFARIIVFLLIFSFAIGLSKGMMGLSAASGAASDGLKASVFASLAIKIALLVVMAFLVARSKFDVSKTYYPIVIVAALGMLVVPLLGEEFLLLEVTVVNTAYNVFIVMLWCIFANLAGQTSLHPVKVFGLGRGASAVGTTVGQGVALFVALRMPLVDTVHYAMAIGLAILVLICSILVLDERTIALALEKTFRRDSGETKPVRHVEDRLVEYVAEHFHLTAREAEMFVYLRHGRTASYIADELGISYNTAKGHIRNLYAKCAVHSRQELIDFADAWISSNIR